MMPSFVLVVSSLLLAGGRRAWSPSSRTESLVPFEILILTGETNQK